MTDREHQANRFAISLDELESSAHVEPADQVEAVPDPHARRVWTSWDEQEKMLRLAGAI